MKTTLRKIWDFNPCGKEKGCGTGWDKLTTTIGTDDLGTEVTILQILDSNGIKDAMWSLRTVNTKHYRLLLADIAESVLYIFEERYPNDDRPRKAIQAIRDYHYGRITKGELQNVAASAASASASAAYAAASAASAAASAAYAASAVDADDAVDAASASAAYAASAADAVDADDAVDAVDAASASAAAAYAAASAAYAASAADADDAVDAVDASAAAAYAAASAAYAAYAADADAVKKWSEIELLLRKELEK